jgi:hypothetical protein
LSGSSGWEPGRQARDAVRQVPFRQGGPLRQDVTNGCAPRVLPLPEIARLSARRWDIERAFLTLKRELGLHLIGSSKASVVLFQVWAALIVAQVVQAIRREVALRAGVDAFEVSLPFLVQNRSFWGASDRDGLRGWVRQGERLGIIRPASRLRTQALGIASQDVLPLPAGIVRSRQPCSRPPKASREPSNQEEEPMHPQRDQWVARLVQREEPLKALRRLAHQSSLPVARSVRAPVARSREPWTPVQPDPTFAQPGWAFLQPLIAARSLLLSLKGGDRNVFARPFPDGGSSCSQPHHGEPGRLHAAVSRPHAFCSSPFLTLIRWKQWLYQVMHILYPTTCAMR